MTVHEARAHLIRLFAQAGLDSPQADASLLLEGLLEMSRTDLLTSGTHRLTEAQTAQLQVWSGRRLSGEPVQHILGRAHFYGLELLVTPDVLVPRPETERLLELVLKDVRTLDNPSVLDVGTGSGALALALKHERPDARVLASDISESALEVARRNARCYGVDIGFVRSDLLLDAEVAAFSRGADLIVANLPYLPEGDRLHVSKEVGRDPELALYAGPDGLAVYRRLERQAFTHLKRDGRLWLELDPRNVALAADIASDWASARVEEDLVGRTRFLRLAR